MKLELSQFTPAEAAAISGRSVAAQQKDRTRGHTAKLDGGHSRYTVTELAELLVLEHVSTELGVTASRARAWTDRAALHVATWALIEQGVLDGPKWKLEAPRPRAGNLEKPKGKRDPRGYRANYTEREAHVYLVAVGAHQSTTNDKEKVVDKLEKECGGSAVVINLRELGRQLAKCADKLGKPLAVRK